MELREVGEERLEMARRILACELRSIDMTDGQFETFGYHPNEFPVFGRPDDDNLQAAARHLISESKKPKRTLTLVFRDADADFIEKAVDHWARWRNCRAANEAAVASAVVDIVGEWASECEGLDVDEIKYQSEPI